MRLNSARAAWHDCYYTRWDNAGSHVEQLGRLGCSVQKTERAVNATHAMHSALAGYIQRAISSLPAQYIAFGNHMYSPLGNHAERDDLREAVEDLVFLTVIQGLPAITAKKREKAGYVCAAVLMRYRRMHQGGQSEGIDPLPTAESFRNYLSEERGVELDSRNWEREWGEFINLCFNACDDFDKTALAPVARVIYELKEAA